MPTPFGLQTGLRHGVRVGFFTVRGGNHSAACRTNPTGFQSKACQTGTIAGDIRLTEAGENDRSKVRS